MNRAVAALNGADRITLGLLGLGSLMVLFTVGYDQGQLMSLSLGDLSYQLNVVHEFFHDARHAAGLACH